MHIRKDLPYLETAQSHQFDTSISRNRHHLQKQSQFFLNSTTINEKNPWTQISKDEFSTVQLPLMSKPRRISEVASESFMDANYSLTSLAPVIRAQDIEEFYQYHRLIRFQQQQNKQHRQIQKVKYRIVGELKDKVELLEQELALHKKSFQKQKQLLRVKKQHYTCQRRAKTQQRESSLMNMKMEIFKMTKVLSSQNKKVKSSEILKGRLKIKSLEEKIGGERKQIYIPIPLGTQVFTPVNHKDQFPIAEHYSNKNYNSRPSLYSNPQSSNNPFTPRKETFYSNYLDMNHKSQPKIEEINSQNHIKYSYNQSKSQNFNHNILAYALNRKIEEQKFRVDLIHQQNKCPKFEDDQENKNLEYFDVDSFQIQAEARKKQSKLNSSNKKVTPELKNLSVAWSQKDQQDAYALELLEHSQKSMKKRASEINNLQQTPTPKTNCKKADKSGQSAIKQQSQRSSLNDQSELSSMMIFENSKRFSNSKRSASSHESEKIKIKTPSNSTIHKKSMNNSQININTSKNSNDTPKSKRSSLGQSRQAKKVQKLIKVPQLSITSQLRSDQHSSKRSEPQLEQKLNRILQISSFSCYEESPRVKTNEDQIKIKQSGNSQAVKLSQANKSNADEDEMINSIKLQTESRISRQINNPSLASKFRAKLKASPLRNSKLEEEADEDILGGISLLAESRISREQASQKISSSKKQSQSQHLAHSAEEQTRRMSNPNKESKLNMSYEQKSASNTDENKIKQCQNKRRIGRSNEFKYLKVMTTSLLPSNELNRCSVEQANEDEEEEVSTHRLRTRSQTPRQTQQKAEGL